MAKQRTKSAEDIINQRNRIRTLIDERYGETSNRQTLENRKHRISTVEGKYLSNIIKNNKKAKAVANRIREYMALGVDGWDKANKARSVLNRIKATRREYMGLSKG